MPVLMHHFLDFAFGFLGNHAHDVLLLGGYKADGGAFFTSPASSADAVGVDIRIFGKIKIDHMA